MVAGALQTINVFLDRIDPEVDPEAAGAAGAIIEGVGAALITSVRERVASSNSEGLRAAGVRKVAVLGKIPMRKIAVLGWLPCWGGCTMRVVAVLGWQHPRQWPCL